ncbi:MAG: leucyl/phenylalanyl-tRNA--protein transferase [Bacteroidota bacterium]
MVFELLNDTIAFPDPTLAEPDGLLAVGGDLSVERLMLAYRHGIFPWFNEDSPILWYAPHQRCIIYPHKVRESKSMRKILQHGVFDITTNQAFEKVIRQCAQTPRQGQDGTWITSEMQQAYIKLYENNLAQSIEVWQNNQLVGGLYGVKMGRVFCGESMFSLVSNASKAALIYLCKTMEFNLIDCQLPNEHLMSMGAEMIDSETYLGFIG